MDRSRNEHDPVPESIIPGEEGLTPVLGSVITAGITSKLRPDSASSEDYSSSSSCGMETGVRRTRNRKTWRQSLQEQDDELELLSVGDWQTKCKNLQSMVRKLQDDLLVVNTEYTRLQNTQIQAQQTKTQSELECKKLQWEIERLTVQLNLTNEENTRLRESCQESDINVIKLRNELLNAKTEVGKATRELDIVKRNSMDHTECVATEERLLGTVAAIKKELNLLREDVGNLDEKAHKRGRTIKELESKVREKDIAIQQLEEKIKQNVPMSANESDALPATPSSHSKFEATEHHLNGEIKTLKQDIAMMESNMNAWFSQLHKMKKLCTDDALADDQSWSNLGTQMKSVTLSSLLYEVLENVKEEVEYSKQLSVFCKESTLRLATAMKKDISFTGGAEQGFKMAVDLVEHACETIDKMEEEPEVNGTTNHDLLGMQDKFHGYLDKWIVNASSVKDTCTERTFMTSATSFVPDTFDEKMEYFSDMMRYLPASVSNSFDRMEGNSEQTISALRSQVQLLNQLKQHMRDFAVVIGLSSSPSDPVSFFKAFEQAFKEASGKSENYSASEDLRMQVNQLTKENDERAIRIKELESRPVPSDDTFAEKHTALVLGLQEIHQLYEKKLTMIEKFSELKVEFVANGLTETDPQAEELKAMQANIATITTQIDDKEESTMGLVKGIARLSETGRLDGGIHHPPPPQEPAPEDRSQCLETEKVLNESIVALKEELNKVNTNMEELSKELRNKDQALGQLEEMLKESEAAKSKLEEKLQEAIESSSQSIEEVIVDHSSWEETEKSLNESIVALKEELNKVNSNMEELSNELRNKDQAFGQLEKTLRESEAAKSKLEEKLQEAIESSSQSIEEVIVDHSSWEETEKSLNESIVALKEELNKVNTNMEELSNELRNKDQALGQLEETLKESEAAKSKLEEKLQEAIESSSQSIEELSNELRNKDQVFRQQEERLKELEEANSKLEERLQEVIDSSSQELVKVTIANSQRHVNEESLKESIAALKEEINTKNDNVAELTKRLQDKEDVIKNLEGRLTDGASKLEESEEVIGDCVSTEERLAADIKKAAGEYNDEITKLKAQLDALVEEKSQWKEDLAAKETFIVKQNHDLAHLRDELHQDAQCQLELNATIEMLNKKLQEAEDKLSVTTVENTESSVEITVGKSIEVLQQEFETERQQHEQILAGKIEEHSANMATLVTDHQNELSVLRSEIDVLNAKLEMKEETETDKTLMEKFEAAEALNVTLKAEIDSIKEKLLSENFSLVADFEAREASFAEQCVNLRAEVEQLIGALAGKDKDIAQYSEQVKQHAVTIVAIEERLNQVIEKNRQYREDIDRQNLEIRDYQLKLEECGRRQEEHVTIVSDASSSSSSSSNQSLTRLRKENVSLKNQNEQAQKVISALRRDIAGLGARLGDVTGDLDEATKREIDEKRIKLSDADRELATHKSKVKSLFTVIDEKLAETKRLSAEIHKLKEAIVKLKKLVEERDEHVKTLQDKLDKGQVEKEKMKTEFEEQGRITKELAAQGATCRGERHAEVVTNQRAALNELRAQIRDLELWPRPVPTHEAALQQVMVLKKELAELRVRESLSSTVPSAIQHISSHGTTTTTTEGIVEKSAHLVTMETLDMSENSYLALLRAVSTSLDIEEVAGLRRLSHIPADEQLKLFREREQSCAIVSNRITLLRERLKRKEELLTGYEQDLAKLHRLEEMSGAQEQQVNNLTHEIRQRTEESQCLRVSLERARLRTEPNRRYVTAVHQDKKLPALNHHHHCVPLDSITAKTQAAKSKEATELMKKKNYEIKTLRTELVRKDHQLDKYKRTMSNKEKTPVPPSGRPSSAKVRRPCPAIKTKRPASAKLQSSTLSAARRSPSPPRSSRTPRELVEDNYQVISSTDDIKKSLEETVDDVQVQASETLAGEVSMATSGTLYSTTASELQSAETATAGLSFNTSQITSSLTSTGGRVSFITEAKTDEGDSSEF